MGECIEFKKREVKLLTVPSTTTILYWLSAYLVWCIHTKNGIFKCNFLVEQ